MPKSPRSTVPTNDREPLHIHDLSEHQSDWLGLFHLLSTSQAAIAHSCRRSVDLVPEHFDPIGELDATTTFLRNQSAQPDIARTVDQVRIAGLSAFRCPDSRRNVLYRAGMSSEASREYLVTLIDGLLTIAKVAMPSDLFAIDPRVKRGQAYLLALGAPSSSARPPNTGDDHLKALLGDILDLRSVDASKMILEWDLVDGLLAARDHGLSLDDNEALNFIVRDWLTAHGYLAPPPEGLQ